MKCRQLTVCVILLSLAGSVIGQETPTTVFNAVPKGLRKLHGRVFNRRGNTPRTELKKPIKALNDPANLESEWPSIKKAAEVKAAEDAAKQKIKGVKYLTKYGCGCYDADGSVTEAIQATMTDCTESVRLAAIEAVADAAEGKCCNNCGQVCCCNEDILKTLAQIGYERDDKGCYLEASQRVRDAARRALVLCCPGEGPVEEEIPVPEVEKKRPITEGIDDGNRPDTEGLDSDDALDGGPDLPDADAPADSDLNGGGLEDLEEVESVLRFSAQPNTPRGTTHVKATPKPSHLLVSPTLQAASHSRLRYPNGVTLTDHAPASQRTLAGAKKASPNGSVLHIDKTRQMAHVHYEKGVAVPAKGTVLDVVRQANNRAHWIGQVQVTDTYPGSINVRGVKGFEGVSAGDLVIATNSAGQKGATRTVRQKSSRVRQVRHQKAVFNGHSSAPASVKPAAKKQRSRHPRTENSVTKQFARVIGGFKRSSR